MVKDTGPELQKKAKWLKSSKTKRGKEAGGEIHEADMLWDSII